MKVLVDTCIWSEAFRKPGKAVNEEIIFELKELIKEYRVIVIGAIRQELLSGVKSDKNFKKLRDALTPFEDFPLQKEDYEFAAEIFNTCRSKGVQGSNTDFLICSISKRHNFSIFTTDKDFELFSKYINIILHNKRAHGS